MLKQHRWKLLASSIAILLPILLGLLLWNKLPAQMTTHWGADGLADGWSSRPFAIFVLPLLLLFLHWVCLFFTLRDPGNRGRNHKVMGLVFWLCPVLSWFSCATLYATALGWTFAIGSLTLPLIGLMFLILGNYLPKCGRNHTFGIKITWTLNSDENWDATHRFGGKVWVIGGLLMLACVFLPESAIIWVLPTLLLLLILLPMLYSYLYYRKQVTAGTAQKKDTTNLTKADRIALKISAVIVPLVLLGCLLLCFTGDIAVQYDADSFTIKATYWDDLTIRYDAIDHIEYRESDDPGSRTYGFGTPRLGMGAFENNEFGSYTRYTYAACESCVVLDIDGKILVLNGKTDAATQAIYEQLTEQMP